VPPVQFVFPAIPTAVLPALAVKTRELRPAPVMLDEEAPAIVRPYLIAYEEERQLERLRDLVLAVVRLHTEPRATDRVEVAQA